MIKNILASTVLFLFVNNAYCQSGVYEKPAKSKNCFDEYYETFIARGAEVVPDGEHNVVFALRNDSGCVCAEGKIIVEKGNIIPDAMIKKSDGTYEPAKRILSPKTGKGDHSLGNVFTVENGMSQTFLTTDFSSVNIFFVEYLKRKPVDNVMASNPNDIAGVELQLTTEEKAIVQKANQGVVFETGKWFIASSGYPRLDKLAEILKSKSLFKLKITGYTDNTGKAESNLSLSKNRANAAKDYLVKKGIDATRITTDGLGTQSPMADNKTPEGRTKNNRVEFMLSQ